jgi:hypothetical protein
MHHIVIPPCSGTKKWLLDVGGYSVSDPGCFRYSWSWAPNSSKSCSASVRHVPVKARHRNPPAAEAPGQPTLGRELTERRQIVGAMRRPIRLGFPDPDRYTRVASPPASVRGARGSEYCVSEPAVRDAAVSRFGDGRSSWANRAGVEQDGRE